MFLDDKFHEIMERAERNSERIVDKAGRDFEKQIAVFEKLDREIEDARKVSRDVIHKIVVISFSIIAFSVSLVSLDFINERVDIIQLYFSWKFFLATIILGFSVLFIEPRIRNALIWRHFIQDTEEIGKDDYDDIITNVPLRRKIRVLFGLLVSIFCPENLIFNKITKDANKKREDAILSHLLLAQLAFVRKTVVFWGENLFLILFFVSLWVFIKSVGVF